MSMRVKLILSYLIMGFLPIILLIFVTFGAIFMAVNSSPFLMSLGDEEDRILKGIDEILNIELLVRENPEALYDKEVLSSIDATLTPFHIGVILLDSNRQVFHSSKFLNQEALLRDIQAAEQQVPRDNIRSVRNDIHSKLDHPTVINYQRLEMQSDFSVFRRFLGKEQQGTLYIAVETGSGKLNSGKNFQGFLAVIFWGMVALILLMTFFVTNSMMQSLRKLRDGVRHISEGDLNFSVKTKKRDEVAQVLMAFEEMRLRLKASIDTQVKEDENRKALIANISHDLKTPVTSIKGYVEGLLDGVADTREKKEKYLSTIHDKTIALDRMIDDLFLYSSLDIGRAQYHFETLAANEFFESLCSETKLDLTERGFEVHCSLHIPADVKVKIDRHMIRRLQHNLTQNAAKYCKASDRKVIFSASLQGAELICSTEDNGIGIQPAEMPRIFERFYRADAARTSMIGGTGLGLQISRHIVEDHGGRIWAESTFGEYTRISWTLPVLLVEGGECHA